MDLCDRLFSQDGRVFLFHSVGVGLGQFGPLTVVRCFYIGILGKSAFHSANGKGAGLCGSDIWIGSLRVIGSSWTWQSRSYFVPLCGFCRRPKCEAVLRFQFDSIQQARSLKIVQFVEILVCHGIIVGENVFVDEVFADREQGCFRIIEQTCTFPRVW